MTAYTTPAQALAILLKIELPAKTIRIVEGGICVWGADVYEASDPDYGSITNFEDFTTSQSDEVPTYELEFAPKSDAAAISLADKANQGAPATLYIAKVDIATGQVVSAKVAYKGIVDYVSRTAGKAADSVKIGLTTKFARFLQTNKGNKLNRSFHRNVWPGEAGLDMASGTTQPVPWGQKWQQQRSGGGGGGGGGGINSNPNYDKK